MKTVRYRLVACLLLALPGMARAEEKGEFYLKDGDRVVFYGDSITDQRLYTTYVETYAVTRFPKRDITFIHSGWGGDRVSGGGGGPIDVRLRRDVLAYKPTVMTIMLGMNDGSYRPFDGRIFETYAKGYQHIVEKMKEEAPGLRLTLIRPSPFDDVTRKPAFEEGYNAVLSRYGDYVKELAGKTGADVADLNGPVVEATKRAFESDPQNAPKLNPDRVHPGPGGQLLMAAALLDAWHAPAVVSRVRIKADAKGEVAHEAEGTRVSGLSCLKNGVFTWEQTDEALPFPINLKDPVVALAVRSSRVVPELDEETLKVEGLEADAYTLAIDDGEVGSFSKAQLAEGVNLATLDTPMSRQAAGVHQLTLRHNDIHFYRWRQVEVPLRDEEAPHKAEALKALDALEGDVIDQQHKAARPKPHRYELRPKSS